MQGLIVLIKLYNTLYTVGTIGRNLDVGKQFVILEKVVVLVFDLFMEPLKHDFNLIYRT